MADIVFLNLQEVLEIRQDQITRYGGSDGIHDLGLLESALAMPQAGFGGQFLHEFPAEMAATYLFHLVSNHTFVDGDKRVGLVAALMFLALNNVHFSATNEEVEEMTLAVAAGKADKAAATAFFRKHAGQ